MDGVTGTFFQLDPPYTFYFKRILNRRRTFAGDMSKNAAYLSPRCKDVYQ